MFECHSQLKPWTRHLIYSRWKSARQNSKSRLAKKQRTRNYSNCDALQLEVVVGFNYGTAPASYCNTSATSFAFGDHDFLSDVGILTTGGHLPVFWSYLHCACAETAISELNRWNSDIAVRFNDLINQIRAIIRQSEDVFQCFHRADWKSVIFLLFDLINLNMCRMLRSALG